MSFRFTPLQIPDVLLIEFDLERDTPAFPGGYFAERYVARAFQERGIPAFLQEGHTQSVYRVPRGMHYQVQPASIGKLVRCIRGRIFDVAVDLRTSRSTFGAWVAHELRTSS